MKSDGSVVLPGGLLVMGEVELRFESISKRLVLYFWPWSVLETSRSSSIVDAWTNTASKAQHAELRGGERVPLRAFQFRVDEKWLSHPLTPLTKGRRSCLRLRMVVWTQLARDQRQRTPGVHASRNR
jgi:hypothetical protein